MTKQNLQAVSMTVKKIFRFLVGLRKAFSVLIFTLLLWFSGSHIAHAASLYLSPGSVNVKSGGTFSVSVIVSSPNQAINAASGSVTFPSDLLQVTSMSKSGSIIKFWVQEPSFLNSQGIAKFEGVVFNPGFTGSAGKVISVTFKAKSAGTATLGIADGKVLLNDGNGTDAFSGSSGSKVVIAESSAVPAAQAAAPAGQVVVTSNTHPDSNVWYNKPDLSVAWNRPTGIYGYSFQLDQKPDTTPDDTLDTTSTTAKTYPRLTDGVWFFHIKGRPQAPGSDFGPVTHFKVQVDTAAPEKFAVTLPDGTKAVSVPASSTILFTAHDATSGIDHYNVALDGKTLADTQDTNYKFAINSPGQHTFTITAFDKAQNSTKADLLVTIVAAAPTFTWPLWLLILLASLLLNVILLVLLLRRKRRHADPADEIAVLQAEVDQHLDELKGYINKKLLSLSNKSSTELKKREAAVAKELNADIGDTQESIDKSIGRMRKVKRKSA